MANNDKKDTAKEKAPSMEELVSEAVAAALSDGDAVKKIIEENVSKMVGDSIERMFSWGDVRKAFDKKLQEIMIPAIEKYDFSKYVLKLEAALQALIENPDVKANNALLENFKAIIGTPDALTKVKPRDLLELYAKHVSRDIDTCGREVDEYGEDGEHPRYVACTCEMDIEEASPFQQMTSQKGYVMCFHSEAKDICGKELNYELRLHRWGWEPEDEYRIAIAMDPKTLRNMTIFEAYVYGLMVNNVHVEFDKREFHDEIEAVPDELPEAKWE